MDNNDWRYGNHAIFSHSNDKKHSFATGSRHNTEHYQVVNYVIFENLWIRIWCSYKVENFRNKSFFSASPTRPKSENKENIRLRENITTGRLNTKPLSTQDKLDRSELRQVLVGFGEFPARYRLLIWRHLLKIPENESSFAALVERGRHPSCDDLGERYPLKSSRLFRALERTLSCVAQWNSLFGELDYIGKGHYNEFHKLEEPKFKNDHDKQWCFSHS